MRGRVRAHVVGQRRRDPPPLEIHPVLIRDAVGFAHLAERAAEPAAPRPGPVMIEKGVPQLVEQQAGQHVPRDFVAAALAGDVATVELDHFRGARRDTRDAGPQGDTIVPVADSGHDQQPPRPPQRARDEVSTGGVLAAPRARRHPIVDAAIAVGS